MTALLPWPGPMFDADALCAETDPEVWFPEKGGSNAAAKELCRRCENEDACLTWAIEHDEQWGVWGGKSYYERRNLAAKKTTARPSRDIRHGTDAGYRAHQRRGDVVPESDPCGCRRAARVAAAEREQRRRAA